MKATVYLDILADPAREIASPREGNAVWPAILDPEVPGLIERAQRAIYNHSPTIKILLGGNKRSKTHMLRVPLTATRYHQGK